jgi:hypothetical protein
MGKPAAVAAKVRADLTNIKCAEPEESIKAKVVEIVEAALRSFPDAAAVSIQASGSQSPAYGADGKAVDGKLTNSVKLEITPIYGFVE